MLYSTQISPVAFRFKNRFGDPFCTNADAVGMCASSMMNE
jgi:hypothetical protein